MKKFIITESEKNQIRKMYGLLNEAEGGSLVPESVYNAISKIESKYSFMDGGEIKGHDYTGKEREGDFKKYIEQTIGLDNWFKIGDKLRGQIYAFAFQSDSGERGIYKNKWIAGLAQAIGGYNRSQISNVNIGTKDKPKFIPVNDPKVQEAINIIKKSCQDGTIDSYYDNYLKILDEQYKSADFKNNYKYIWKYRPTAIERFMNGENEDVILNDWEKSFGEKTTTQPQQQNTQVTNNKKIPNTQVINNKKITIEGSGLSDLRDNLKSQTKGLSVDLDSSSLDLPNMKVSINPGNQKVEFFTILWSITSSDELNNRTDNAIRKNSNDYNVKKVGNIKTAELPDTDGVVKDWWAQLLVFLTK